MRYNNIIPRECEGPKARKESTMQKIVVFDKPIEGRIVSDSINSYIHQGWKVKDAKESGSVFGKIIFVLER